MSVLPDLTEEEAALFAILTDDTGIELAEFEFADPLHPSGCYRVRDYQWELYDDRSQFQATRGGRNLGKSMGIQARCAVHPFANPGSDLLLTAPQLNHLRPLTQHVEERLKESWLVRQMLPINQKSDGFHRAPHWECHFVNGAKLISRLPGPGPQYVGVKGQHAKKIEVDEIQDYPDDAMKQLRECLNTEDGAQFRVHGVPTGVRGFFYDVTEGSGSQWSVHQPMAMMRENWNDIERRDKINFYKGRTTQAYKCNLYGDHGEAATALFVLARLIKCIDLEFESEYNTDVYTKVELRFDELDGSSAVDELAARLNGLHKSSWTHAKKGYQSFHGGMDVGITNDPTEILVFGQRAGVEKEKLDLLLRVHMKQIDINEQARVVDLLFDWFGSRLTTFGIDSTAVGFGTGKALEEKYPGRVRPFNFGEKVLIGIADRELQPGETEDDLQIMRNAIDAASDWLRDLVDSYDFLLPNDDELIRDWQGQTVVTTGRTATDPYGKRSYQGGKALALDTPVPTPTGWTTMGQLEEGDHVFDERGRRTTVVEALPVLHGRPCYEVEFSDGSIITADAQHLWETSSVSDRCRGLARTSVLTTEEIAATLMSPSPAQSARGVRNHSVRVAAPLQYDESLLSVPPYTLGAWLGDGDSARGYITTMDSEILEEIRREGVEAHPVPSREGLSRARTYRLEYAGEPTGRPHHGLSADLRRLGVRGAKHIPAQYLRGSEPQRRALLAGLVDTDGTVSKTGKVEICLSDARLAADTLELVLSLGEKATMTERATASGRTGYRVRWTPRSANPARLTRKRARVRPRTRGEGRTIVDVRPATSVPVRCIVVDSPSHLFLAGRAMIPTHNSHTLDSAKTMIAAKRLIPLHALLYAEPPQEDILDVFVGML